MSTPPSRVPTFEELYRRIERLPQGIAGQILVPGVLTTMSRPGSAHAHPLAHCGRALAALPTLVASARDDDRATVAPFGAELALGASWKSRPAPTSGRPGRATEQHPRT